MLRCLLKRIEKIVIFGTRGRQKADPRPRTDSENGNQRTQKQTNDNEVDERIKDDEYRENSDDNDQSTF